MCGIAGIVNLDAGPLTDQQQRALGLINNAMHRRGPDSAGSWSSARGCGLAHRRLSIIDLSAAGNQPMTNEDETLQLVMNGEIYNYRTLRTELEKQGHLFQSDSDAEVILHLYESSGLDMLPRLEGMFAFALWDEAAAQLVLARDPHGIKPLYYSLHGGQLRFASQVKALLAAADQPRSPDPAARAGLLIWGHVPEPLTAVSGIQALPAGHCLTLQVPGTPTVRKWASVAGAFAGAGQETRDWDPAVLRGALLDSIERHLVADVEVGLFLSAGIDSTSILALCSELGTRPRCLTLGFSEYTGRADDEVPVAAAFAETNGCRHLVRTVEQSEFEQDLPNIISAMDQPTIDGVNSWFVSKAAAEVGLKVALSGLGGDELFGGYPSFTDIPNWRRRLRLLSRTPGAARAFAATAKILTAGPMQLAPKLPGLLRHAGTDSGLYLLRRGLHLPEELTGLIPDADAVLRQLAAATGPADILDHDFKGSDYATIAALESCLYMRNQLLRDLDWAGMAHSLEVRVPLVDWKLLNSVAPYLAGRSWTGKQDLAIAAGLPEQIAARPKTGFSVPVPRWVGAEVRKRYGTSTETGGYRGWARIVWDRWFETI